MPDGDLERLRDIKRELYYRRCRDDLTAFATQASAPLGLTPARHHKLICAKLMQLVDGTLGKKRLLITAPLGCGKTYYTSRIFPAWFLAQPNRCLISVSHIAGFAETNSAHVQRHIRHNTDVLGYSLTSEGRDHWTTSNGGEAWWAGADGTVRGNRADVLLLDDVVKNLEQALSEGSRAKQWDSYHSDMLRRLKPGGVVILIGTPLHQDDLLCRLRREHAEDWDVLQLKAFATDADDPLGRQIDEPLWADQPQYGYHQDLRRIRDEATRANMLRDFGAQYQGEPTPREGALFLPGMINQIDALPDGAWIQFRAWDFAASEGKGDWTVGVKLIMAATGELRYFIADIKRIRGGPEKVRRLILDIAQADGRMTRILIPEDPGSAGKDQAQSLMAMLSGYHVTAIRQSGDKELRAQPFAALVNEGKLTITQAPWNTAYLDELSAFPYGSHDDQVDACSLAFNYAAGKDNKLAVWRRL
jgi:predicted phage terminase large subunit-like protein